MQNTGREAASSSDIAGALEAHDGNSGAVDPLADTDDPCPICLALLDQSYDGQNAKEIAVLNSCKHRFCFTCIEAWSSVTNTCPMCKQRFSELRTFSYADSLLYLQQNRTLTGNITQIQEVQVENKEQTYLDEDGYWNATGYWDPGFDLNDGVQCIEDHCRVRQGDYGAPGAHFSVQCNACEVWFHGCCVGFRNEDDNIPLVWNCPGCAGPSGELTAAPGIDGLVALDNEPVEGSAGQAAAGASEHSTAEILEIEGQDDPEIIVPPQPVESPQERRKRMRSLAAEINRAPFEDFSTFSPEMCSVCGHDSVPGENEILFCDRCDLAVHQKCYGVAYVPDGKWFCNVCLAGFSTPPPCVFCPVSHCDDQGPGASMDDFPSRHGGVMKQTTDGRWAHSHCALWIPEAGFMDPVKMEPIGCIDKFHRRGGLSDIPDNAHMQICNLCGSCEGLTLACSHPGCRFTFHPICGKQAAFYMEIEASGNAQQVAMIAYCKHHTMRLRTDKLTGRDMEVWIPDKGVWAKARIGFYFPAEKKHRIVYHIDGVVEEMVDLRALLRRGKKASSPPKLEFYENGYMIPTVRLLNEPYARRPDETKDSKCPPALKVCVSDRSDQSYFHIPKKCWVCRNCNGHNSILRFQCEICCLDSRNWEDSIFSENKALARTLEPRKKVQFERSRYAFV
jgi:hypothetical protein